VGKWTLAGNHSNVSGTQENNRKLKFLIFFW